MLQENKKREENIHTRSRNYTINEEEALKIINAPKTKVKISDAYCNYNSLSKKEQSDLARRILDKWKESTD